MFVNNGILIMQIMVLLTRALFIIVSQLQIISFHLRILDVLVLVMC